MKKQLVISAALLLILQACASAPVDRVPQVQCGDFEAINAPELKNRSLNVIVKDEKEMNLRAGNAKDVESRIDEVLTCAAEKGGFKVGKSTNILTVSLFDCVQEGNKKAAAESACVDIRAELKTPEFTSNLHSRASSGKSYTHKEIVYNGKMDEAYQSALSGIINQLNGKLR